MKRNKLIAILGIAVVLFAFLKMCKGSDTNKSNSNTQKTINYDSIHRVALNQVKTEPKVKDAIITDANILYVSVLDDGTDRSGYASYFCELLKEYKSKVNTVKVVQFGTSESENKDNAYGILLGSSRCQY